MKNEFFITNSYPRSNRKRDAFKLFGLMVFAFAMLAVGLHMRADDISRCYDTKKVSAYSYRGKVTSHPTCPPLASSNCTLEAVTFSAKDMNLNKERSARYHKNKTTACIKVWSWRGDNRLPYGQMIRTTNKVLNGLSMVKDDPNLTALILETIAAETEFGLYVQQIKGPALGVIQMLPSTAKDTLTWLRQNHSDVYKELSVFYNRKLNVEQNLKHNIPWQIAMAAVYYWRRSGDRLYSTITTVQDRATLYRLVYNTPKGKCSAPEYINRARSNLTVL